MSSPTQRSLKYLRDLGMIAQVVERWNPFAKIRQDLFGWVDIVAMDVPRGRVVFVQTTTKHNMKDRIKKVHSLPTFKQAKKCGVVIYVHGWYKTGRLWGIEEVIL